MQSPANYCKLVNTLEVKEKCHGIKPYPTTPHHLFFKKKKRWHFSQNLRDETIAQQNQRFKGENEAFFFFFRSIFAFFIFLFSI